MNPTEGLLVVRPVGAGSSAAGLVVSGDLDTGGAPLLRTAWDAGVDALPPTVHLDLRRVTFCNAAGLHVLAHIMVSSRARGVDLTVSVGPRLARLMAVVGLDGSLGAAVRTVPGAPSGPPAPPATGPPADRVARAPEGDLTGMLAATLAAATEVVPAADAATVVVRGRGRGAPSTAATGPLHDALVLEEHRLRQGPSWSCWQDRRDVVVGDLHGPDAASRWPELARRTAGLPVRSVIALHLSVPGRSVGALTITAPGPEAFDGGARESARALASLAGLAVAAALDHGTLTQALASRTVIGQATGIVMERRRVTAGQAFDLLKAVSMARNVAVHQLAVDITRTGVVPDVPPPRRPS